MKYVVSLLILAFLAVGSILFLEVYGKEGGSASAITTILIAIGPTVGVIITVLKSSEAVAVAQQAKEATDKANLKLDSGVVKIEEGIRKTDAVAIQLDGRLTAFMKLMEDRLTEVQRQALNNEAAAFAKGKEAERDVSGKASDLAAVAQQATAKISSLNVEAVDLAVIAESTKIKFADSRALVKELEERAVEFANDAKRSREKIAELRKELFDQSVAQEHGPPRPLEKPGGPGKEHDTKSDP